MAPDPTQEQAALVDAIADQARARGMSIGVAESLTGGRIASCLAAGDDAGTWFRGAVVAYAPGVKFDVLGVDRGPVNRVECARSMASGAVRVLAADLAVSVTGVGGPGSDEGVPAGTVFLACADTSGWTVARERRFGGTPAEVIAQATTACLRLLAECATRPRGCA
ncbi:MAG: CinA domain protein [Marmoricola sp.]|nr:CinA domain protein [Marmoricola sp.]